MRWMLLSLAAGLMLLALGVTTTDTASSLRCVAVTAVVGVLAPLFWPGSADTPARTAWRVGGWSLAAAGLALALLLVLGRGQPMPALRPALGACLMLLPLLLLGHALAAGLPALWRPSAGHPAHAHNGARALTGLAASLALVLLGALPLWLGPAAELLSVDHAGINDLVIGLSPLTHLAVASDNDLLRNQWFYEHSNLAALPVAYPGLADIGVAYAAVLLTLMLALAGLARRRRRRPADAVPIPSPTEPVR